MTNGLLMSELAHARIADLHREAEVQRLTRAARQLPARRRLTPWRRLVARLIGRVRQHAPAEPPPVPLPQQRTRSDSSTVSQCR
jgi:hypothetical protein